MSAPFDAVATGYDASFSDTRLGRWYRDRVWEVVADNVPADSHVLDLGCGTGEDAAWLCGRGGTVTALDASSGMLEVASVKLEAAGLGSQVELLHVDLDDHQGLRSALTDHGPFDAALADFGVLNCIRDRPALAATLAEVLDPGARLVAVVMPPLCVWESLWYLAHGEVGASARRLRGATTARVAPGSNVELDYPTPRRLRREFAAGFDHVRTGALGVTLPPSGFAAIGERDRAALPLLFRWDQRLTASRTAAWVADHYVTVLERR